MRLIFIAGLALLSLAAAAQVPEALIIADMEGDFATYRGVMRDTQVVKVGGSSARWDDHVKNRAATFEGIPSDWSGFDNLEFWLNSKVANGASLMLIISSENPETEGIDYWSRKITVDWAGWRHFRIPIKSLGRGARKPRGWDQIDRLYFTASGWNCEPREDTVLWIDDVRLTNDPCRVKLESTAAERRGGLLRGTHIISVTNRLAGALRLRPRAQAQEGISVSFEPGELSLAPEGSARLTTTVKVPEAAASADALAEQEVVVRLVADDQSPEEAVSLRLPLNVLYFTSLPAAPHPRVLLNAELLKDLRRRVKEEERSRETAEAIVKSADGLVERYAKGVPPEERASIERGRNLTGRAETVAMAYLLTDDPKYAHEAAKLIAAARDWSTWVLEFHKGMVADLGTAGALRHFGVAYDWAYQGMTEEERQTCRDTIKIGLDLWLKGVAEGIWWGRSFRSNWCAVCCGGGGLAGIALLGENPDAPKVIAEAYPRIVKFLNEGGEDGGWPEGTGYWGYGVSHAALFADALKIVSEGASDLFQHPYLKITWQFPLYMYCPPNGTINFADCGYHRPNPQLTLEIGKETENPYAVWYYRLRPGRSTLDLLWDREALEAREPGDLPQSIHFRGIDWAVLRSGWGTDATIFGLRGGNNGENHGMLECGNFVINSRGERLIMDYGAMKYTHEYFSGKRWGFYRANSHGSNVVLVDDQDQLPGRAAAGEITDFFTSESLDYLRLDATKAYPEFVKQMERRTLFIKPDLFVMLDNVVTDGERGFEWRCHPATAGDVALGQAKMAVENGRAGLAVRWLRPEGVTVVGERKEGEDYHVSVRPSEKAERMQFLTVMLCHGAGAQQAREELARAPRVLLIMEAEGNEWRTIRDLIRAQGIEVDWVNEDLLPSLPTDSRRLQGYAAILVVPTAKGAAAFSAEQQKALVEYVRAGGGLVLAGGTKSFGAGGFDRSPLGAILPVKIIRPDDNVTHIKQRPFATAKGHPVLAGLPDEWPVFGSAYGGYYDVRLRKDATELLRVDQEVAQADVPFVAVREAGRGRVMTFGALWAFGTGQEFKTWELAGRFFGNAIGWLSHDGAKPDANRKLGGLSLEPPQFPLSEQAVAALKTNSGLGCRFADLLGGGQVLLRTGTGPLVGGGFATDGQALAAFGGNGPADRPKLLAAVAATQVEADSEVLLRSSQPISLALAAEDGTMSGIVECRQATEIALRVGVAERVFVDGEVAELQPAQEAGFVKLALRAGRHAIRLE